MAKKSKEGKYDNIVKENKTEKRLLFNPETEITKEDWERIKNSLKNWRKQEQWQAFLAEAAVAKTLFPEKTGELDLDEAALQKVTRGMKGNLRGYLGNDLISHLEYAVRAKTLFPEKFSEFDVPNEETLQLLDQNELADEHNHAKRNNKWNEWAIIAKDMKIIFPERVSKLNLGETDWQGIKNEAEKCRQEKDWRNFLSLAVAAKIVFPEKFSELNLDETTWQEIRHRLQAVREFGTINEFAEMAADAKIITTEKIEVTDKGLEIKMPEST